MARYAERLARGLNLPEEEVERVRIAALLRDVGEVGVAESILNKPSPLNDEERRELERHPEIGARIVGAAQLGRVGEWILSHHERPDGGGYPRGLREHQIPLEGRILAVADAYAAMTADRPYRRPFSPKRAKAELQARAGSQFDHDVVAAFLSLNGELESDAEPEHGRAAGGGLSGAAAAAASRALGLARRAFRRGPRSSRATRGWPGSRGSPPARQAFR